MPPLYTCLSRPMHRRMVVSKEELPIVQKRYVLAEDSEEERVLRRNIERTFPAPFVYSLYQYTRSCSVMFTNRHRKLFLRVLYLLRHNDARREELHHRDPKSSSPVVFVM